ncbi:MAG TPA: hypothetical protein VFM42_03150 [Sphingomicrobium sp.]|jgi:hypothetical protein|nr:hypothetical protein [Sphingomicrobium sp.]
MTHDSEYFRRRAAEARAAACSKGEDQSIEVAGDLARAYAALARRHDERPEAESAVPEMPVSQSEPA